jgi:hypothetical protein
LSVTPFKFIIDKLPTLLDKTRILIHDPFVKKQLPISPLIIDIVDVILKDLSEKTAIAYKGKLKGKTTSEKIDFLLDEIFKVKLKYNPSAPVGEMSYLTKMIKSI